MSWNAPWMPSLAAIIEMSWAVPGRIPVSSMYWIIVIGPNQKRCRGRNGLSVAAIHVPPATALSGPVI